MLKRLGNAIFDRLQRVTSSGKLIPEIDGLRFVAIFSVFVYHVNGIINTKDPEAYKQTSGLNGFWKSYITHGNLGVQLFFVISGFILALPFARHYLTGSKRPALKAYFMRRVTRLEPPYMLVMIMLFCYIVFIQHKYTFSALFPDLLQSLTYTFNFFHPRLVLPTVNPVAWSLEIEVQFYLLAPLLAALFFKSANATTRRTKIILGGLSFIVLQSLYEPPIRSLYDQMQYFLLGFLLADIYLYPLKVRIDASLAKWLGGFVLFALWLYEPTGVLSWQSTLSWNLALICMIFVFYYLTLFTPFWNTVFSKRIFVTIGGMCYTIYLIHSAIISIVLNLVMKHRYSNWYAVNWLILACTVTIATLLVSACFFLLVEKPFMEKTWYKRFLPQKKGPAAQY